MKLQLLLLSPAAKAIEAELMEIFEPIGMVGLLLAVGTVELYKNSSMFVIHYFDQNARSTHEPNARELDRALRYLAK